MGDETLRRLVRTARQYSQSTEIVGQFLVDLTQEEYAQVVLAECQRRSSEGIRPWVITHLLKSLSDEDYSAIILPESRRRSNANRIPFPTNVEQWSTRHVVPPATLNIGVGGTWLTSFQVGWGVWLPKEH